jgi:hypothetical protein
VCVVDCVLEVLHALELFSSEAGERVSVTEDLEKHIAAVKIVVLYANQALHTTDRKDDLDVDRVYNVLGDGKLLLTKNVFERSIHHFHERIVIHHSVTRTHAETEHIQEVDALSLKKKVRTQQRDRVLRVVGIVAHITPGWDDELISCKTRTCAIMCVSLMREIDGVHLHRNWRLEFAWRDLGDGNEIGISTLHRLTSC